MTFSKLLRFVIGALLLAFVIGFFSALVGQFVAPASALAFGGLGFGISLMRSALVLVAPGLWQMGAAFTDMLPGMPVSSWERSLWAEARAEQKRRKLDPIMLPGYIRSEVVLPATTNGFIFAVRADETFLGQAVQQQESRLNINDAFYVTDFSVMFYQFETATANPARVRARLQTFANDKVFGANAPEVECMYNGNLSLKVDSTTFIDKLDMNAFKFAEYAEQGLAVSAVAVTGVNGQNAWRQSEAFKRITSPLVRLNGAGRNEFSLSFPDTVASTLVASNSLCAVLYLRGWKSSNGGAFRPGQ